MSYTTFSFNIILTNMIISITNKTTIGDVQRKLSIAFPFLKVEFFHAANHHGEKAYKYQWYDCDERFFDIVKQSKPGRIILQSWRKCGYVKEVFEKRFGLHPQFFRRKNEEWIEIAGTQDFTIEEQNEIGRKSVEKKHRTSWRERELLL